MTEISGFAAARLSDKSAVLHLKAEERITNLKGLMISHSHYHDFNTGNTSFANSFRLRSAMG